MRSRMRVGRFPVLHVADERGAGPTVILIHGIASSSITFQNVLPLIAGRHRCVAIDILGFGGSPAPAWAEYTLAEHAMALERTVSAMKIRGPFVLVGHSMGALIAARYAARYPRRVSRLVLVSPPIYLAPTEISSGVERTSLDLHLKAYRYLRENKEFTLRNVKILERLLPIPKTVSIDEKGWPAFVKSLKNSIESQTTISDLAAVRVPVEVVYGGLDEFHSKGVMRIVARMRGVNVHKVSGSNHLIGRRLARVVATAVG
jgi:pimeloyl-ACP methyl ester carboxylesterase